MTKLKKDLYDYRYALIIVILYCTLTQIIFGKMCIINILFEIDCPGCGLTRATIALFKGHIKESLEYNYTCIFWLITFFVFFFDRYIKPLKIRPFPYIFIITCIITIVRYALLLISR